MSLLVVLLPASQVTASWAVGWPWGFSLILAVGGFEVANAARLQTGPLHLAGVIAAMLLYIVATFIYQSNTMFVAALLGAALLAPQQRLLDYRQQLSLSVYHLVLLIVALAMSFLVLHLLFAGGIFSKSGRLEFETDIVGKLVWFVEWPLANAIAFPVLRDDFGTGQIIFGVMIVIVLATVGFAMIRSGLQQRVTPWLFPILVLPWVAHGISLVAAERSMGYRTLFALSGLVVIVFVAAWQELPFEKIFGGRYAASLQRGSLVLLTAVCTVLAWHQSYDLIAKPQGREWSIVKNAVKHIPTNKTPVIFLVEPSLADRSTKRVCRDEFGSLSSNSSWVPDEMFKAAIHDRFPDGWPHHWHYVLYHGGEIPSTNEHYDQLIDMRVLKQWRNQG